VSEAGNECVPANEQIFMARHTQLLLEKRRHEFRVNSRERCSWFCKRYMGNKKKQEINKNTTKSQKQVAPTKPYYICKPSLQQSIEPVPIDGGFGPSRAHALFDRRLHTQVVTARGRDGRRRAVTGRVHCETDGVGLTRQLVVVIKVKLARLQSRDGATNTRRSKQLHTRVSM
jgi:hypothetical protein